jgi:DNA-binding winged helix-turn-helix (wHTH) protein
MYILVLAENNISASFISRGLKYENIISEPKIFNDDVFNNNIIDNFDCLIVRMPTSPSLTNKYIKKLNSVKINKPIFILINRDFFLFENEKQNIPTKYIYPHNISIRYLAFELKRNIKNKLINDNQSILKIYNIKLNLDTREVTRFNKTQFLRNKEFQLCEYLMRNTDLLLTRQMLLENVWDRNAHLITNTVDVHINSLRRKIDNIPDERLIETIHCNGYIMHSKPFYEN